MGQLRFCFTWGSLISLLVSASMLGACALKKGGTSSSALAASVQITDPALNQKAMTALSRCASCHAQAASLTSMVAAGWVLPGNAAGSILYSRVKDGTMAPGNPLAASEVVTVHDWIQNGMIIVTPVTPTPSATPPAGLSALGQKAFGILSTNCAGCHGAGSVGDGGINYILDFNQDISHNLAVPGNPSGSSIYTDISAGTMPPGAKLSASDTQTIFDWIQTDLKAGAPQPQPSVIPLNATFASISSNILVPKCTGCHGAAKADSGVRYDTYTATLRTVVKGSPTSSKLYTTCKSGSMPQGGTKLNAAQLQAVSDWITGGALNN